MSDKSPKHVVYVFVGHGSTVPNAVFSSIESLKRWVEPNKLSGNVYCHILDRPSFDDRLAEGNILPKRLRSEIKTAEDAAQYRQTWFDGRDYFKCILGICADDPRFLDTLEQWDRAQRGDGEQ